MKSRKTKRRIRPHHCSAASRKHGERGYTMIALLALMSILMIGVMAAAPSMQHQAKREREKEAIRRGEEVAEAIRLFVQNQKRLPSTMEELTEGITPPGRTKKLQLLRASSARDPLSSSGEWKLVRVNDPQMLDFTRGVAAYINQPLQPRSTEPLLQPYEMQLIQMAGPSVRGLTGTPDTQTDNSEDETENAKGPFIGVASRSRRKSIIAYYGIEQQGGWVFTPLFR